MFVYTSEQQKIVSDIQSKKHNYSLNDYTVVPFNWDQYVLLLRRSGLHGYVLKKLCQESGFVVPQQLLSKQLELHKGSVLKAMQMSHELQRVFDFLISKGVVVLTFKGPTLALQYYGDISARDYCDLDILVKPDSVKKTITLLSQIGYDYKPSDLSAEDFDKHITLRQECTLVHRKNGIPIDLHWGFHKTTLRYINRIDPLFKRAVSTEIVTGKKVLTLSPVDLLFIESIHLFDDFSKKQFSLKLAADYLKITEALSHEEWHEVVKMHKEQKQLGKLCCWCSLITALWGDVLPLIMKNELVFKSIQVRLGKQIAEEFFSPKPFTISYLLSLCSLFDNPFDSVKFVLHLILFSITERDKFITNRFIRFIFFLLTPIRALTVKLVK